MLEAIVEHLDDIEDLYAAEQHLTGQRTGGSEAAQRGDVLRCYGMDPQASSRCLSRFGQVGPDGSPEHLRSPARSH